MRKNKFQESVLCSGDHRDGTYDERNDGPVALQERLEDAAAAVKATTTAMRKQNKFTVRDEIGEMAAEAAKFTNPMRRKSLRKAARKARREFDAGRAVLPGGKVVRRPVVTKLWINGRASEDRDEWTEEVRAHCEKCFDDKTEMSEVQAERIRYLELSLRQLGRSPGQTYTDHSRDRVLRARGKMMKNKANGPADCLVTEMQRCGQFFALCSQRSQTPSSKKGLRGFRVIALLGLFS